MQWYLSLNWIVTMVLSYGHYSFDTSMCVILHNAYMGFEIDERSEKNLSEFVVAETFL